MIKDSKFKKFIKEIFYFILIILPALIAFLGQRILISYPEFTEKYYTTLIFRIIRGPISYLSSLVWFSITEIMLYISIPIGIFFIYYLIRKLIIEKNKGNYIFKLFKKLTLTVSILYLVFMLLHGFNYARLSLDKTLNLEVKDRSANELFEVAKTLQEEVNYYRENMIEDENGNMILRNGVMDALKNGYKGFNEAEKTYDVFILPKVRAKGVLASYYWSYTGIVGMYFPFFAEANINIDTPDSLIPATIMHELAHVAGFARENEAEFVSFITGINHPNEDFVYSLYLKAYIYVSNSLYRANREYYDELYSNLSEKVINDLKERREYARSFEGPVKDVSTSVNHAYLQSNHQTDGVRSYGQVVDLILAYYLT